MAAAGSGRFTERQRLRSHDWRDAGQPDRTAGRRDDGERHAAGADAALARRRHRDAARHQPPARDLVDPLARHRAAREHGRRPGPELQRHRPGRDLRLPVRGPPERHLLVPQPLGIPGAEGPVWPARHRSARAGRRLARPRARRDAHRLDRRGSGAHLLEAEEAIGLLQLPPAHGRRLRPRRARARPAAGRSPNAPRGAGCG